jgi:hypothetical protein
MRMSGNKHNIQFDAKIEDKSFIPVLFQFELLVALTIA